jgi:hypothetical protein
MTRPQFLVTQSMKKATKQKWQINCACFHRSLNFEIKCIDMLVIINTMELRNEHNGGIDEFI